MSRNSGSKLPKGLVLLIPALLLLALVVLAFLGLPSINPPKIPPTMGYGPVAQTHIINGTPTLSPAATVTPSTSRIVTPTITPAAKPVDERFGVIITGLENLTQAEQSVGLRYALDTTGARWWYQYGAKLPEVPGTSQVRLVRVGGKGTLEKFQADLNKQLAAISPFQTGSLYWMIGNEPNTPGQDDASPEYYAGAFELAAKTIKAARPGDKLIAPNVLNWNYTCNGCPGYTTGLEWVEKFRAAYRTSTGQEPPVDIWSIHTYSLDWNSLPLVNRQRDARQLEAIRAYLETLPSEKGKPVWLTEFGVIWGYDALTWRKDPQGNWQSLPGGTFREDLLLDYLGGSLDWLQANAGRLGIERWFIYTTYGVPEPFSQSFNGLALFNGVGAGAALSPFGKLYQSRLALSRP